MKLTGENIYLRFIENKDAEALCDLFIRNREFFQKYSPARSDDYYDVDARRKEIRKSIKQRNNDEKYSFGIFLNSTDELIGNVNLSGVVRGPLQSCLIGYSLDKAHNGRGYMQEAVRLAVEFAFKSLNLHRVEAGVMPSNSGSMRVLEKVGFHKEGIAKKNVKINGVWEDHQMFAIISEDN